MVVGVGSGGTLTGLGRYFAKVSPKTEMVLADPVGSVLAPLVKTGKMERGRQLDGRRASARISCRPMPTCRWSRRPIRSPTSRACWRCATCCRGKAFWPARPPARCLSAALRYCREQTTPKRVVTFVCDSGNKYLSKVFNDFWLAEQGLAEREQHGDLRDLVARSHREGGTVSVGPDDTLLTAYGRMRARRRLAAAGAGRRQARRHPRRERHPGRGRRSL